MIECFNYLIVACDTEEKKEALMLQYLDPLLDAIESMNVMNSSDCEEDRPLVISCFIDCMEHFQSFSFIDDDLLQRITTSFSMCISSYIKAKEELIYSYDSLGEYQTEQDIGEVKEKLDEIAEILSEIVEAISLILKSFGCQLTDTITTIYYPKFKKIIAKTINTEKEKLGILCFFCEVIDNLDNNFLDSNYQYIFDILFDIYKEHIELKECPSSSLLQTITYLIGSIANHLDPLKYCEYSEQLLKLLDKILKSEYSKKADYGEAIDNLKGSLFKISIFQKDCIVVNDSIVKMALKFLPLTYDLNEGKAINKLFIKKISENCENLFGFENCNAKEISEAMARIIEYKHKHPKKKVVDEELLQMLNSLDINCMIPASKD